MVSEKMIVGQAHTLQGDLSTRPLGRLARIRRYHALSRLERPCYGVVLGTAMKLADVLLLSAAMCTIALPVDAVRLLHDPGLALAYRFSVRGLVVLAFSSIFWTSVLHSVGVYDDRRATTGRTLLLRLYTGVGICSVMTLIMLHLRNLDRSIVLPLLTFFASSFLLMALTRLVALCSDRYIRPCFRPVRRAIVVGTDVRFIASEQRLDLHHECWYDVVGFVSATPAASGHFAGRPLLGALPDLKHLLMREHVDEVLVALPVSSFEQEVCQVLQLCASIGVRSRCLSNLLTEAGGTLPEDGDDRLDRVLPRDEDASSHQAVKRCVDLLGALFGLVLLSPLFVLIACLIKGTSRGPVFFSQVRYGLNKRRFVMRKFRSMVPGAEEQQAGLEHLNETDGAVFKIKNDPRVTGIGRFLRKTSLDELPQLWNVLCGEMSLVGPRPLPARDVHNFAELSLVRRFSAKPGMTGLWQVSGRSNTSFDGLVRLDLYYIDHWSLRMDARILMRTVPAVVRGSGAS